MAGAKKKTKIKASEIEVDTRALEGDLLDLAERIKADDALYAERSAQIDERAAQIDERSARARKQSVVALQTIAEVLQDLRALNKEPRGFEARTGA